tara:strand:+ start:1047 stop:1634 length:588 start_codon:yes stop_codon:yes gene_type:complete
MYDDGEGEAQPFDFEELADHLFEQGAPCSPAQLHGCLSGLLAAGADGSDEYGLDATGQALELTLHGELAVRVMQLYRATGAALGDEAFGFHPLLPDDATDIQLRTRSLAQWCEAFLTGIAHGASAAVNWSEQGREILEDIAAMAQAEVGEEESEDEAEDSYLEIVDYLRFAVLNLYMEHAEAPQDRGRPPAGTLH